jgi:TRAP-type C4-dicarboxylate transport system permease small subunit
MAPGSSVAGGGRAAPAFSAGKSPAGTQAAAPAPIALKRRISRTRRTDRGFTDFNADACFVRPARGPPWPTGDAGRRGHVWGTMTQSHGSSQTGGPPRRPRSGPMAALSAIDRTFEVFEKYVLSYGVLIMAVVTIANVFGRNVFQQSLYFAEELNQFLIVLITWVGLGYASRKGRHIRMSAIYDQMNERIKKVMMIIMCAGTAAVMFLLAYYSINYIGGLIQRGTVTPALRVPLWATYIWVPVGFVITGIQYSMAIVRNLQEEEVFISYTEVDAYDEGDPTLGSGS